MNDAIRRRFEAATGIVDAAAALAMRMRPAPGIATLKEAHDWLTEADGAVEALIAGSILTLFPKDDFQGEEGGVRSRDGAASGMRWVVDPIDGTANFARGGATLNGAPIRAAATRDAKAATIEIGWGPKLSAADYTATIARLLALGVAPRTCGSGALALADVACGRLDCYVELSINLWDVAGALPILAEAGAVVSPFLRDGGLEGAIRILASAPGISRLVSEASGIAL